MRVKSPHLIGLCWITLLFVASPGVASSLAAAGDLRLVNAAKHGQIEVVRALVKQKVPVNTPQPDGTTALHWAAERNDADMVALLLASGADANAANTFGVTPLSLACTNGNATMVNVLVRSGANPNTALPTGETPLMTAARAGRVDAVNALVEAHADLKAKESVGGQTALMWAIAEGHADVVQALIKAGADVHTGSKKGFTPLLFAARNGDIETTKLLLAAGVDVNEASRDGATALTIATIRSQVAYAKFLLNLGANPNLGPGFTPLHWVVGDWTIDLAGDNTNARPEGSEWDLLLPLFGQARLDYVKLLLAYGADVNARAEATPRASAGTGGARRGGGGGGGGEGGDGNKQAGATAFIMAAQFGNVPLMRLLLANGADPLIKTRRNVTAMMFAAGVDSNKSIGYTSVSEADAVEAVKLCLEVGEEARMVSTYGENALHGAGYRGNAGSNKLAQLLLDHGAEVNVKNKRGWTPITLAEGIYTQNSNSANPDLVQLLLAHGAKPSPPDIERDAYAVIVEREESK